MSMRYRSDDPYSDPFTLPIAAGSPDTNINTLHPSTAPSTIGAGFQPQSPIGVRVVDPFDDRVDYMAGEDGRPMSTIQYSLPADVNGVGTDAVYGGLTFGGITYAENAVSTGAGNRHFRAIDEDAAPNIVANVDGFWYDTLRPQAGYPLVGVPDKTWANATNDATGDNVNDVQPLMVPVGTRIVAESPVDVPMRLSGHPATSQVVRPWDTVLGAWPWSGDKAAAAQPVVSSPLFFGDPIKDGLPSPTGAAGSMVPNTPSMDPNPMTWRAQPSPWDDGTGDSFIDAGTRRSFR